MLFEIRKWLILPLIALSFAGSFFDETHLRTALEAGALLLFLTCLFDARRVYAAIALIFITAGGLLHADFGAGAVIWRGFAEMFPVVVLLYVSAVMAIPLRLGPYMGALSRVFFSLTRNPGSIFPATLTLAYLLSVIMNLAAVPMATTAFGDVLKRMDERWRKRVLAQVLPRGFSLAILWTPVTALNVSTAHEAGADWNEVFPFAIGLSLLLLAVNSVWGFVSLNRSAPGWMTDYAPTTSEKMVRESGDSRATAEFFGVVVLFMVLLLLGNRLLDVGILALVSMLIPVYALGWSLRLRRTMAFGERIRGYFRSDVPRFTDQPTLFLAVGYFVVALAETGSLASLDSVVESVALVLGPGVILVLVLLPVLLSQLGLFPVLAAILVAQLISPESVGLRPEWLALAAMGGAISGTPSSGLSVISNATAAVVGITPAEVARQNAGYAAISIVATTLLVAALQFLLPA